MTFIRIRDRLKDTKAQTESLKFLQQRDVFWGGWYRWLGAQTAGEPMTLAPLLSIAPLPPGHLVPVKFGQKAEKFLLYILRYLHSGCRNEWFSTCSLLLLQKVTILLNSHTYTGISCRNFFHSTILPPWRVSWVSTKHAIWGLVR